MSSWSPRVVVALALALALGCHDRVPPSAKAGASRDAAPGPAAPLVAPAVPLPEVATDGAIGQAGPARFIGAADDGSWVLVCQTNGTKERLRVVVGDGPGIEVDRVVATTDRDLIVVDGGALVHVDAVARTRRDIGPPAVATVDAASRRVVHADGDRLIVRDPGVPPREVATGAPTSALWSPSKRWVQVTPGTPSPNLAGGYCGYVVTPESPRGTERATLDLDPSGVEAVERVGPELGITAAGEVTLDGAVVVDAECVGTVVAALADPPRALVMCGHGDARVVGPGGFVRRVAGYLAPREFASIAESLTLGQRLVCVAGACVDLVTGRDFRTDGADPVWSTPNLLVRKRGGGLIVDALDQDRQREIALPRVTQAVTIDTATGRRRAGPAPEAPTFIDGAGRFLLYGRYLIDTDEARLVATLPDTGLAVDRRGRVLIADRADQGPLRWRRP